MKMEEMISGQLSAYEIERGKPMPSRNHSIVQSNIAVAIVSKYKDRYSVLTELSLSLNNKLLTPDICIYPKITVDWFHDEVKVTEPPITTVKILSATQGVQDFPEKFDAYFAAGVKSCWFVQPMLQTIFIISPDKSISVFNKGTLTDPANGISLEMNEIFS